CSRAAFLRKSWERQKREGKRKKAKGKSGERRHLLNFFLFPFSFFLPSVQTRVPRRSRVGGGLHRRRHRGQGVNRSGDAAADVRFGQQRLLERDVFDERECDEIGNIRHRQVRA